jgi:hypothetical protein
VQAKFIPLAKRQQGPDDEHPAGALVEMRRVQMSAHA